MARTFTDDESYRFTLSGSGFDKDQGTMAVWAKPTSYAAYKCYLHLEDANSPLFYFDGATLTLYNDSRTKNISHGLSTGSWLHFAWTWNKTGNVQRFFVNGSEVGAGAGSGTWGSTGAGATVWIFAQSGPAGGTYVIGDLAELGIWPTVLSDGQIVNLGSDKYAPSLVGSPLLYVPMINSDTPSVGPSLTVTGTPSNATHPPDIVYSLGGGASFVPRILIF